jgi:hypothetical protein
MPDMPEAGAMRFIREGTRLILQRFESSPRATLEWSDLASGENLNEIHKHISKLFDYHYNAYNPHIAVDSSVPQWITAALKVTVWAIRRKGGDYR